MIIVGYQGIGKSSLAKGGNGFIDLESSSFWVDGKRDPNWARVYADMAVRLSSQGYNVFTASHKEVRAAIKAHPSVNNTSGKLPEIMAVCYPMPSLEQEWIAKLKKRYEETGLEKDYKAWRNADTMFLENVMDLSDEKLPVIHIPIYSMDYNLEELLAGASIFRTGRAAVAT